MMLPPVPTSTPTEKNDERLHAYERDKPRTRPTLHQHDSRARARRGSEGRVGPPWIAFGLRAARVRPLDALHAPQPARPEVARARPLSLERGPRLDAPLLAPLPDGLRPPARRV